MRTPLRERLRTPEDWIERQQQPLRSRLWWLAAVIVAVIVVVGVVVLATGHGARRAAPSGPAAPVDSAPTAPASAAPSSCAELGLPAADTVIPQSLPGVVWHAPGEGWAPIGRVQAPSAPGVGPAGAGLGPGLGVCYAHTPTGALFAAATFLAFITDPARIAAATEQLTADTLGRAVVLEQLRKDPAGVLGSGSPWQIAGFTFLAATPDTTAVTVVIRGAAGGFAAVPVTLTWNDDEGTWQVLLPDDGNLVARSSPLTTLDGYTAWQAR